MSMMSDIDSGPDDLRLLLAPEIRHQVPTALNTQEKFQFLYIDPTKTSATYEGRGINQFDAGVIRSSIPFPSDRDLVYFEVEIIGVGPKKPSISVGLSLEEYQLGNIVGKDDFSFGYDCEGKKAYGKGSEEKYGEPYGAVGDVIGCGVNYWRQTIFFTKNGKFLGDAFGGNVSKLYPTVSLHSPGDSVRFNFNGESQKFAFDFEAHVAAFKQNRLQEMQNQTIPSALPLIRNYLTHFGFAQTLIAFEKSTNSGPASQSEVDPSLRHRKTLRDMVMNGEVMSAIEMANKLFPGLLTEHRRDVLFRLQCQLFIELVRSGQLLEAVRLSQDVFREALMSNSNNLGENASEEVITEHMGLLCYSNLADAPMQYLLSQNHREETFDVLNAAVLEQAHRSKASALEILTRHLSDLSERVRAANEFSGSLFDLSAFVNGDDTFCP